MIDLRHQMDIAIAAAIDVIRAGKENPAIVLLFIGDNVDTIIPMNMENERTKAASIAMLKHAVEFRGSDAIIFVTEGWGLETHEKDIEKARGLRPSKSPDRMEMLIVEGKTRDGDNLFYLGKIKRGDDGIEISTITPIGRPAGEYECRFTKEIWPR